MGKLGKESTKKKKVKFKLFNDEITKESAYILGLLWADGHIRTDKKLTTINCIKTDIDEIIPVFNKTGDWNISNPIKKTFEGNLVKTQLRLSTTTWGLFDILSNYGYIDKSNGTPDITLSNIPKEYKKYWFRGYLDGDGCIKLGKKYGVEVVFAGPYNQDWLFMCGLCDEFSINYSIDNRLVKKGGYSHFRINKKLDVKKLCDYIYDDYDGIGFSRKYEKYLDVLNYIDTKSKLFWSDKDVSILIENYKSIGGEKCGELLNKNLNSIYNKVRLLKDKNML